MTAEPAVPAPAADFEVLRSAPDLVAERQRLASYLSAPPDKTSIVDWRAVVRGAVATTGSVG